MICLYLLFIEFSKRVLGCSVSWWLDLGCQVQAKSVGRFGTRCGNLTVDKMMFVLCNHVLCCDINVAWFGVLGFVAGVFSITRCGVQRYRGRNDWVRLLLLTFISFTLVCKCSGEYSIATWRDIDFATVQGVQHSHFFNYSRPVMKLRILDFALWR